MAFNGIRYDEEMLRHSFYQTLRKPYQTQFGGNTRADAMLLAQAADVLCPGTLHVPLNENGNPTFKLEGLAKANGFGLPNAHDALADVRMMLELARLIRNKAPAVWSLLPTWTDKSAVEAVFRDGDVVGLVQCVAGSGRIRTLLPLCPNPAYPTEWGLVDIALDPDSFLGMSSHDLLNAMKPRAKLRPVVKVKTNAMPLVVPAASTVLSGCISREDQVLLEKVRKIRSVPAFSENVGEALRMSREGFDEPEQVEDKLYSGGFFPLREDEALVQQFHSAKPIGKLDVLARVRDPRARQLGERIVFDEWPEALPAEKLRSMQNALLARLMGDYSVPWMTVPKAYREIEKLLVGADPTQAGILIEYKQYLVSSYGNLAAE